MYLDSSLVRGQLGSKQNCGVPDPMEDDVADWSPGGFQEEGMPPQLPLSPPPHDARGTQAPNQCSNSTLGARTQRCWSQTSRAPGSRAPYCSVSKPQLSRLTLVTFDHYWIEWTCSQPAYIYRITRPRRQTNSTLSPCAPFILTTIHTGRAA